jgi:hypothetical protein
MFVSFLLPRILAKKHMEKTVRCCREFLTQITSVDVLLLAMMADASDEELSLIRNFDQSYLPTSDVRCLVERFISRIEFLFLRSGALELGYTKYAAALAFQYNSITIGTQ